MDFTFKEAGIKNGELAQFYEICPGALGLYMVLCAYASEKSKIAKVSIETIIEKTGFSLDKVVRTIRMLKAEGLIEAPFEGRKGKAQIYKLKGI